MLKLTTWQQQQKIFDNNTIRVHAMTTKIISFNFSLHCSYKYTALCHFCTMLRVACSTVVYSCYVAQNIVDYFAWYAHKRVCTQSKYVYKHMYVQYIYVKKYICTSMHILYKCLYVFSPEYVMFLARRWQSSLQLIHCEHHSLNLPAGVKRKKHVQLLSHHMRSYFPISRPPHLPTSPSFSIHRYHSLSAFAA